MKSSIAPRSEVSSGDDSTSLSRPTPASAPARRSTMKAIVRERYGPPDVLELREVDMATIEDHQVLVRVHASSVK